MAQDLRKLFKNEKKVSHQPMPDGHEARFLNKLEENLPSYFGRQNFNFLKFAATVVILIGLSFAAYKLINFNQSTVPVEVANAKTLEDVSPDLKKVEDYYLASINLELSKLEYSPENKELFDGYVRRLAELSSEYDRLSKELIESGPNEQTVTALIDNLKLRLNLMYRLKEKLNELNNDDSLEEIQS